MDIRIQLANHLLTRANVHPIALLALCYLLHNQYEGIIYDDNYYDQLNALIKNIPAPPNFDTRAELMQGLINNDKLNPTALKIFASIINKLQKSPESNENNELGLNETVWQDYLNKIGVDELYEDTGDR